MSAAAEESVTAVCGARIVVRVQGGAVTLTERDVSQRHVRMTDIYQFDPGQAVALAGAISRAVPLAEQGEAEALRRQAAHLRKEIDGAASRLAAIERRLSEIAPAAEPDPVPGAG